jgi:hypothetical protein
MNGLNNKRLINQLESASKWEEWRDGSCWIHTYVRKPARVWPSSKGWPGDKALDRDYRVLKTVQGSVGRLFK